MPAQLLPLGDSALLARFAETLTDEANRSALALAAELRRRPLPGVLEIVPSLVSVLVRFDPLLANADVLAGEMRLAISTIDAAPPPAGEATPIPVRFGGTEGPDLPGVASSLDLGEDEFVRLHNAAVLRVLATGFAPGFVYCGLHPEGLTVPRRREVRRRVPEGSILFAAGQTAITATGIPTGWNVIGRTDFRNFDAGATPPVRLRGGDLVRFVPA